MTKTFRITVCFLIIIGWSIYYSMLWKDGLFHISRQSPLHLCNIMQIFIIYAALQNDKRIIEIMICPLIIGPAIAISYPFGIVSYGTEYAIYFFYYHLVLLFIGVHHLIKINFEISFKTVMYNGVFIYLCAACVGIINPIIGSNYMFVTTPVFQLPVNYYFILNAATLTTLFGFYYLVKGMKLMTTMIRVGGSRIKY